MVDWLALILVILIAWTILGMFMAIFIVVSKYIKGETISKKQFIFLMLMCGPAFILVYLIALPICLAVLSVIGSITKYFDSLGEP